MPNHDLSQSFQESSMSQNLTKEIQTIKNHYTSICLSPVKPSNNILKDLHSKKKLYICENVSPFLKNTNCIVLECTVSQKSNSPITIVTDKFHNREINFSLLPITRKREKNHSHFELKIPPKPQSSLLKKMFKRNKNRWDKKLKGFSSKKVTKKVKTKLNLVGKKFDDKN